MFKYSYYLPHINKDLSVIITFRKVALDYMYKTLETHDGYQSYATY